MEEPAVLDKPVSSDASYLKRFHTLEDLFVAKYGRKPDFYARAPGRVNIIGEHIDYMGYAVLPMAVQQDILIACCKNDTNTLNIANTDSKKFPEFHVKVSECTIEKGGPWHNYFLCGFRGIVEQLGLTSPVGMDVMMDGNVPMAAGLSSSSAFVCCSGLATMYVNGGHLSKIDIANVCTWCERYIGTEGGGMDQSISFLAETGQAKLIEFEPKLSAATVPIPPGVDFVVANSLVVANKAGANSEYNKRVVQCRLAAQVIASVRGLPWQDKRRLCEIQNALNLSREQMLSVVDEILHPEPYTREELTKLLGVSDAELVEFSLKSKNESTLKMTSFKLHDRAAHVFSESDRVYSFKRICDDGAADAAVHLGELMNASHRSCSELYECSCPELDELTKICRYGVFISASQNAISLTDRKANLYCHAAAIREAGALGSRLTGAGWGGCCVSMVPSEKVDSFLHEVTEHYYEARSLPVSEHSLFPTKAGSGAHIVCM